MIVFWHWLVVAAVFAVIEVAVPAMVCIWFAVAALGTAAIAWLAPDLAWEHQALIFAALAIASVAIGRIAFARIRARPSGGPSQSPRGGLYRPDVHTGAPDRRRRAGGSESTTRCGSSRDPIFRPGPACRSPASTTPCCASLSSDLSCASHKVTCDPHSE